MIENSILRNNMPGGLLIYVKKCAIISITGEHTILVCLIN